MSLKRSFIPVAFAAALSAAPAAPAQATGNGGGIVMGALYTIQTNADHLAKNSELNNPPLFASSGPVSTPGAFMLKLGGTIGLILLATGALSLSSSDWSALRRRLTRRNGPSI